jgi:hypothetical protein
LANPEYVAAMYLGASPELLPKKLVLTFGTLIDLFRVDFAPPLLLSLGVMICGMLNELLIFS